MSPLERLRTLRAARSQQATFSENTPRERPTELTKPGSVGFVGPPSGGFSKNHTEAQQWRDLFEERAAIREYDGKMSRADAEAGALVDCVQRWRALNPLPASGDGACAHCGKRGPDTPVLARGGHAWLHRDCWGPMNEARHRHALVVVRALLEVVP
jgi:hypothetical protein